MPLLTLDRVALAFGHLPLLADGTLRIEAGERLALVGRNGAGKSSLLRILSGEVAPDAGTVWRMPGLRVASLAQEADLDSDLSVRDEVARGWTPGPTDDAWERAHRVDEVLSRLALPADRRMCDLSGGWRRRVLLGRALAADPDLLLLDEPTNHLDIEAIEWLERHLVSFRGAVLLVTHDRAFVRTVATRIVELDRGRLTSWPGDYDRFVASKLAALETEARAAERFDKKLAEEEAWLRRGVKARRTRDEGRVDALMEMRETRAARRTVQGTVRLSIETAEASGATVFEAERVAKHYGALTVVSGFSTRVVRGDRIGLVGPNGSGKTTLLRLLVGEIVPDGGSVRTGARLQVAYFDQQREQLDPDRTVVESVADSETVTVNGQPRHVLGYLADFLFPKERAHSPVRSLSGGERNRLLLARLFARPANVLVLDEPTNDLDFETLDLLEARLTEFEGTVLIVTHDRAFLDAIVDRIWAFDGRGGVTEHVGGWTDYVRETRSARVADRAPALNPEPKPAALEAAGGVRPVPRKRSYNEEREFASMPGRVDALEQERAALLAESHDPAFYKAAPDRIAFVLTRIEDVGRELDVLLERWVTLESIGG